MAEVAHVERDDLHLEEVIGHGGFATVHKGRWNERDVAVKVMRMEETADDDDASLMLLQKFDEFRFVATVLSPQKLALTFVSRQEVILMAGLEHPNLVMLKGMCLDSKHSDMLMITEYVPLGDLYHYLHKCSRPLSWSLIVLPRLSMRFLIMALTFSLSVLVNQLRIAADIALGMDFLHNATPPIVHNDLKSPNILLATDDVLADVVAKVADFGMSARQVSLPQSGRDILNC